MLPLNLKASLESHLGTAIVHSQPCYGGDINQAEQINTQTERYFVKWNPQSPPKMFEAEARGLEILNAVNTLRVPQVIVYQGETPDTPAFLLLEWLDSGRSNAHTQIQLGAGLAQLHQMQAEHYGLDHANYIGSLPQSNQQTQSWLEFYGEQRIRTQMEIAQTKQRLSATLEKNLNNLIARLPELLPENPIISLLHGDLWAGNVMTLADGQPAIIDPAVYYGHREVEMSFTELFGGFRSVFYESYQAQYPLDKSYGKRKTIYQLYPLMTHMNLFGGGYTARVEAIAKQYGS